LSSTQPPHPVVQRQQSNSSEKRTGRAYASLPGIAIGQAGAEESA
jgi:hypothetical protein